MANILDGGNARSFSNAVVKWTFEDVYETGPEPYLYTWGINPNDGGSVSVEKNIMQSQTTGPNRVAVLQEGQSQAPLLDFSGIILTQEQLETMELWYDKRLFIKITDDLGRSYYGIFNKFTPRRVRHAGNFWFHSYDAEFTVAAYMTASGNWRYGRQL